MDGGTPILPDDIIRIIFKRLPVKSLIQIQCVCKHWKNLIKTPSFIAEHIHYNTPLQNPYLLFQGYGLYNRLGCHFFNHQMQVVDAPSQHLIGSLSTVRIIGSINGLICFQSNLLAIFIWNPATRVVRQVSDEDANISACRHYRIGFGFSSITNDYKVVRIHCSINHVVHVFSLNTGAWSEIECGSYLDGVSLISDGFYANGAIFWFGFKRGMGEEDKNDSHLVVSFDLATEVVTLIPLPPSVPKERGNKLVVYEDKLAILCHNILGNYQFSSIDMWVMEEGACDELGRWNWTKKYSSSPYPSFLRPGTILGNTIVCNFVGIGANRHERRNGEGKFVLFNITSNEVKTLAVPKCSGGSGLFYNYVESLVSVGNNEIEDF